MMQLDFKISFSKLYTRSELIKLDEEFLDYVKLSDESLFCSLIEAREKAASFTELTRYLTFRSGKQEGWIPISNTCMTGDCNSQLIIEISYLLDKFIAKLFDIEKEIEELKKKHNDFAVIYKCKKFFIQRYALKKYTDVINIDYVTSRLNSFITLPTTEKNFSEQVMSWLKNEEDHKEEIELAAQYAVWRVKNKQSTLFSIHKKIDYENLVSFLKKEVDEVEVLYSDKVKRRYGFDLTSKKVSLNKVLDNAHYCIFCHKQNKDSCSKGLINRDKNTFKKSPLRVELHGCPLEQKISEMNLVKSKGYSIAGLAIVMIDNPLCAATGSRICNDCMNSCIYQKQEPVNVPSVETGILDDVLNLPYGFEIYSLLSRWNPLNFQRPLPKENTGKNILVVGLGPAGFNLAHHLLNDGHNVIAIDGLKIEPLIDHLQLIKIFEREKLSERIIGGFGGVAEYGITSRWDKNYLKIIRLLLQRRENFALYGGIRFGSTITVDDSFNLGFDHISLALGSGNPQIIEIKNILARGVRMASDFLMSLQLTGALKFDSIVNLQVRMPIVVIGAGLTAIDTATEALAYYPIQVEKFLLRYEILIDKYGEEYVKKDWTEEEYEIANELISHAKLIRREQALAKKEKREIKILELMQSFGGVKIVYRKDLKNSPSYRLNSEEVQNALSEGIYFIENLEPTEFITDKYNHVEFIKLINTKSNEIKCIKARSILIAIGNQPNTAIVTEDKKHFQLSNGYFVHLNSLGKKIDSVFSPKMQDKDRILVYKESNRAISFFGDLHPSYRGSVVKAMASAKNGYPIISQLLNKVNNPIYITPTIFSGSYTQSYNYSNIEVTFSKKDSISIPKYWNPENLISNEYSKWSSQNWITVLSSYIASPSIKITYKFRHLYTTMPCLGIISERLAKKKFFNKIKEQFTAEVIKVQYLTSKVVEIVIKAPLAAKNFKPGQFFKLQNFETDSRKSNNANLPMEGIAVTGAEVDKKEGFISTIVLESGGSTNLCKYFKKGEQVILMGPTGSPTEI